MSAGGAYDLAQAISMIICVIAMLRTGQCVWRAHKNRLLALQY